MKVIVNKKDFIQSLSLGSSFSGKNKALSALDYTRLVFNGNRCRVTSNDGEMAITTSYEIGASLLEEHQFYIDAKTIINALRSIKEENVSLDFNDKSCVIEHERGKFEVPYGDVDVYPVPSMDKEPTTVVVSSEKLFNWLKEARQFVATDELRPVMCGVYIYIKDNSIGVCASDGSRLYTDCDDFNTDREVDAILSAKAITTILDMINDTNETMIYFGERNVAFRAGSTSVMCRKIDGRFPNFNSVIPRAYKFSVSCNKEEFSDSLARCLIMANNNSLIKMTLESGIMKLVAEDLDFSKKGEDFVDLTQHTMTDSLFEIGFKGTFAKTCLEAISSEIVSLELTEASRAIVMKDANNGNKTILLMPLQIN